MARTNDLKDILLIAAPYAGVAQYGALFTANPGTTGANTSEVTGGTYARQVLGWNAPAAGLVPGERAITAVTIFDVPAGVTVTYVATCLSSGGADVLDVTPCVPPYGPNLTATQLTVTFTSNEGG